MLFSLHVYSSWYFLHTAAIDVALSWPKCDASSFAMLSVDNKVPYRSKATTILPMSAIAFVDDEGSSVMIC